MEQSRINPVQAYALAPKARAPRMAVPDGLALFLWKDRSPNRRQFVERLQGRVKAEAAAARSFSEIKGQAFQWRLCNRGIEIQKSFPAPFLTLFPEQFR
jgi:hypothetical protein